MNKSFEDHHHLATRRTFLGATAGTVGSTALSTLLARVASATSASRSGAIAGSPSSADHGLPTLPHFAPKAKRVLCLFQAGGISHVDLFDFKPSLAKHNGQEIPPSVKGNQRLTGMTSGQAHFPVVAPMWPGRRCGQHGTWISDLLPHTQKIADDLCIIKSTYTEAINHDPAQTFFCTGNQQPGYASMGAWISYGLGTENENLPTFIAMISQGTGKNPGQPIFSRLWGNGFLPSTHQGVALRAGASPVLYLADPPGTDRIQRRALLDDLDELNHLRAAQTGDPETLARIAAYEMAFRMQTSVPELTDLSTEPANIIQSYGPEVHKAGSYAANCLLARRLLERGVRFVQLFHRGWDQHIAIRRQLPNQCHDIDQPTAALISDLKQRGLLEDTLVMFLTEFGRTVFSQGVFGDANSGRDHHGRCFTTLLAGAGVRPGIEYGRTDDFCYNIAENPVHLRDIHATMLHILGIDNTRFTYPFRGLDTRLTGVEDAHVVRGILT
ncbi:MAG TPA: DUF1501 domain-containing protein [Lacipirellulaceae bacterium]|nr:DUF1501 domain-containing protein [Lacipirellulaceae bacterium]